VLTVLVLLAASCGGDGGSSTSTPTTAPPVTSTTTTTVPVASTTTTQPATTTTEPPALIFPRSVSCTSELAAFPCDALADGDPATRWNAADGGVGATVTFAFDPPIQITGITFENVAEEEPFSRNARIRTVRVTADDIGGSTGFDLADERAPQRFDLETAATSVLQLTIVAAYPGREFDGSPPYEELALAGIGFLGYPADLPDLPEGSAAGRPAAAGLSALAEIEAGGAGEIRDIAFDGQSFLALAWLRDGETTLWASLDGLMWERRSRIGWFDPGDGPSVLIPAGEAGIVATGRHVASAAAWRSADDGASWVEVRLDEGQIADGALTPVGLVAVGSDPLGGAAVWWSDDGEAWEATSGEDLPAGGPLTRVAASGELLLALGDASSGIAAATSLDGRVWRPLEPEGLEAAAIGDLVIDEGTALVLDPAGPVLWSAAGTGTWSPDPLLRMLTGPGETATGAGLALLGNRLVLVGGAGPAVPGPDDTPAVPRGWMREPDGTWTALRPPDPGPLPLSPVAWAAGRGRIVVALDDGAGGLVVWVAQPA
jgi:hypothetical protein